MIIYFFNNRYKLRQQRHAPLIFLISGWKLDPPSPEDDLICLEGEKALRHLFNCNVLVGVVYGAFRLTDENIFPKKPIPLSSK